MCSLHREQRAFKYKARRYLLITEQFNKSIETLHTYEQTEQKDLFAVLFVVNLFIVSAFFIKTVDLYKYIAFKYWDNFKTSY